MRARMVVCSSTLLMSSSKRLSSFSSIVFSSSIRSGSFSLPIALLLDFGLRGPARDAEDLAREIEPTGRAAVADVVDPRRRRLLQQIARGQIGRASCRERG